MPKVTFHNSTWTPTPEVTQHNGRSLHPKMTFFAPPPPEIGSVVTAYSSVKNDKVSLRIQWHLVSDAAWVIIGCSFFIWGSIFGILLFTFGHSDANLMDSNLMLVLASVLTLIILLILMKPIVGSCLYQDTVCSYVGEQGIAEYHWTEENRLDEKILLFAEFKSLRRQITEVYVRRYSNRSWIDYSGTKYCLTWCPNEAEAVHFSFPAYNQPWFVAYSRKQKASGRLISSRSISGLFFSKSGRPRRNDPYYFATSVERVWTSFCLQRAQAELEQHGSARFLVAGGDLLEIQPGLLKVVHSTDIHQYNKNEVRLSAEDNQVLMQNSSNQWVGYEYNEMIIIGRANPEVPWKKLDICIIDHSTIDNLETFLTLFETILVADSES